MKLKGALFLAFKNIHSSSGNSDLFRHIRGAIIGIALSLVPLIVVLQIADGMIQGITERYVEIGSYHFQVKKLSGKSGSSIPEVISSLKENSDIENVFEFTQGTSLAYTEKGRTGIPVRGIPEDLYSNDEKLQKFIKVVEGDFDLSDEKSIILSRSIAEKLDTEVGEELKLLTAYSRPGRPPLLKPSRFTVKGIITTGYSDLDEMTVYIKNTRGKKIFRDANSSQIGIKVNNPYENTSYYYNSIRSSVPSDFFVLSWDRINYTFYQSLETTKKLLMFIMLLILGVASINISSAMIMMVLSNQKEIAVLKSVGFSPSELVLTYIFTGFFIGIAGTVLGVAGGILCSVNINGIIYFIESLLNKVKYFIWIITGSSRGLEFNPYKILESGYYLEKIPVVINFEEIFLVAFVSLLLATAASYIPSARAGKIKPVEIFQKH